MKISELEVGDSLESVVIKQVKRLDLIKYAGASGDFNPIHTIDSEAIKAGLPGIIAHGMWTMGNFSKVFTPFYNEGYLSHFEVKFLNMVFIDDRLTLYTTLVEKRDNLLLFKVNVFNQNEIKILKGEAKFILT